MYFVAHMSLLGSVVANSVPVRMGVSLVLCVYTLYLMKET